jgi:NADH-quinone oxidoreductase subunit F
MDKTILVCCGNGCTANGARKVLAALENACGGPAGSPAVKAMAKATGCHGLCEEGPLVRIMPDDVCYYRVRPEDAGEIVQALDAGKTVGRLLYKNAEGKTFTAQKEHPFYAPQVKIALRNVGLIAPGNVEEYAPRGGFAALKKALAMTPDAIIREVETSGIRGRGGAGFPAGKKWRQCAGFDDSPKYVVCNGDEGDPGAFMDGAILEGDPLSVIEGLTIAALAVGAKEGFMYIRDEYELALKSVYKALAAARENNYLGKNILGSGRDFDISVVRGGGAFVCGESSALMSSIEGKVGEPRTKYIRSVQRGLWDKPTVLNNVETLANIPWIIQNGGEKYAAIGTKTSTGTKVFALVGKVNRTGLVEVPMGTTLRQLVFGAGGGIPAGRKFKAVQTGGPSGGCIPESLLDVEIDFDSLGKHGSMMGSGGIIVMDDNTCMVEVARYYTNFLAEESCGKCTPCREGLRKMLEILNDITQGRGREGDIEELEALGETMTAAALCGLGKSAPNPVLTTIKYFRGEYEAHISKKECPAGICPALTVFSIDAEKCAGCTRCKKSCPANAITGELKAKHAVIAEKCIACGSCKTVCAFGAVTTQGRKQYA